MRYYYSIRCAANASHLIRWSFTIFHTVTLHRSDLKHRVLGWECAWRFASRSFSIFQPASNCLNPVRQCGDAVRPQLWPSSVWSISAVFGHCVKVTFKLHFRAAENGRNRPRLAIRAVTIFRGRALSQSATVNKAHMVPRLLATSETPQTRDRGLKTLGVVRYETPRIEHVRSRVSTSLIGA